MLNLKDLDDAWALRKSKRKAFMQAKGLRYNKTTRSVRAAAILAARAPKLRS